MNANESKRRRWLAALEKLQAVRWTPPPATEEIDRVMAALGPRLPGERLENWFARANPLRPGLAAPASRFRLSVLDEEVLLAAKGVGRPLPSGPILFPNGDFRLTVEAREDKLRLFVEAMGVAIDQYQNRCLAVAVGRDEAIAFVRLDEEGEGVAWVEDTEENRAGLFHPFLLLVEEGDA